MARYEIKCVDCGADHVVSRKDGKYCSSCRLLRVLLHAASGPSRKRQCKLCGRPFRPMNKKDWTLCGHCTPSRTDAPVKQCRLCRKTRPVVDGVQVCRPCVKDPVQQPKLIAALRRGRDARRDANQVAT